MNEVAKECRNCRLWRKIKGVPFGTCGLPDSIGLAGEAPQWEDGAMVTATGSFLIVVTDRASCSSFESKGA